MSRWLDEQLANLKMKLEWLALTVLLGLELVALGKSGSRIKAALYLLAPQGLHFPRARPSFSDIRATCENYASFKSIAFPFGNVTMLPKSALKSTSISSIVGRSHELPLIKNTFGILDFQ